MNGMDNCTETGGNTLRMWAHKDRVPKIAIRFKWNEYRNTKDNQNLVTKSE